MAPISNMRHAQTHVMHITASPRSGLVKIEPAEVMALALFAQIFQTVENDQLYHLGHLRARAVGSVFV